jgi:hypothetical protein
LADHIEVASLAEIRYALEQGGHVPSQVRGAQSVIYPSGLVMPTVAATPHD